MGDSKRSKVAQHLAEHKSITSLEAIELYGATRLAAIVFDLRADGWPIETVTIQSKDRYGHTVRFAKYVLAADVVKVGEAC